AVAHVLRGGIAVAAEEAVERGILPALDEGGHLQVLRQPADDLLRLRRERVDAGFGDVPAMMVAPGEVVRAGDEDEEEERIDERPGAVARGAPADETPEVLEAERQVREHERHPDDEVRQHVSVAERVADQEDGYEAEAEEEEPEKSE